MPYVKSEDGYKIFYNCANLDSKKPILLFVHGWIVNWTCFKNEINYFKRKGYPVIYFDMRGHGRSDVPLKKEEYNLNIVADDIKLILDSLNVKRKINLIGHSYGGTVALVFAIRHNSYLEDLILIDSAYKAPDKLMVSRKFEKNVLLNHFFQHLLKNKKLHRKELHHRDYRDLSELQHESGVVFFLHNLIKSPIFTTIYFVDNLYKLKIKSKLKNITTRTLIICSKHDQLYTYNIEKEMSKLIPNSDIVMFEGDHALIEKDPLHVSRKIKEFLDTKK